MRMLPKSSSGNCLLILSLLLTTSPFYAQVFVDQNATGSNTGTSWTDAYTDLQDALKNSGSGSIWVAKGTYKPVDCAPCLLPDREMTFEIPPEVQLYGGFAGNETSLEQRNWTTNLTILTGDIGTPLDSTDNVFNVLTAVNSTTNTVLDGFIIEAGNADGSFGFTVGGGLLLNGNTSGTANIQIHHCTFRNNYADAGGAIAIDCGLAGTSRAVIRDCTFEGNTAALRTVSSGGAIQIYGNSGAKLEPHIINCLFRNNYSGGLGGGIAAVPTGENTELFPLIDSCRFENNRADGQGGAMAFRMASFGASAIQVLNCEFFSNSSGGQGGAVYFESRFNNLANDLLVNCIFRQNAAGGSDAQNDGEGGAVFFCGSQSGNRKQTLINCVFDRNFAEHRGGAVATTAFSSAPGTCHTDFINCTFSGNNTPGDGGALHMEDTEGVNTADIFNSILWGNSAGGNGPEIRSNTPTVNLAYSDIDGGVPNGVNDAGNNLDLNPQFVDPSGGDLHLGPCSPLIDTGDNAALSPDHQDLDGDGNTAEAIPVDLDGMDRIFQGTVDLGAYEFDGAVSALTVNRNIKNESCGGACDGEAILVPSGGKAGYTFAWSNGQAAPKISGLCAGTYYVTINDAATCTQVDSVTIEAGEALGLVVSPDTSICAGETVNLSATASGGSGSLSYSWDNGLGGGNAQSVTPGMSNTYSVTVTDFKGCTEEKAITVTVDALPKPTIAGEFAVCPESSTVLDAGIFATYQWSTGAMTRQLEVNAAGPYQVTVTDDNGCIGAEEAMVSEADSLAVVIQGALSFCPGGNTSLDAGSFATYEWSTGALTPQISVSVPGSYGVLVRDERGCVGEATVSVSESDSLEIDIQGLTSFCPAGSTLLEAGNFSTYLWSTGEATAQIEVATAGIYSLTVTDADNCLGTAQVTIAKRESPMVEILGESTLCPGNSTVLDAGVFSTYQWSNGDTSRQITVDRADTYRVTVSDDSGCTGVGETETKVDILVPLQISGLTTLCPGDSLILDGGSGYFGYRWSNGETSQTIIVKEEGTYQLTVSSETGCSETEEAEVNFDLPELAATGPDVSICSDRITITANLPPGTTGIWTTASGAEILDPLSGTTQVSAIGSEAATFIWTLSTADCPDYSRDSLLVSPGRGPVAVDDQAQIPAGGDRTIRLDLLANDDLSGIASPTVSILSEPGVGNLEMLDNGVFIYNVPEGPVGNYRFTYELCGPTCPCSTADVTISIEKEVRPEKEISNTITPNGDGLNESFVFDIIKNASPAERPDNELIIFNRWGDIVYRTEDYDNTWNGMNNQGEALPEATYYFILRLNIGEGKIIRGDVTVIR